MKNLWSTLSRLGSKGVGLSTALAWPGWMQPEIAVEVTRHDSKQAGSKNFVWTMYYSNTLVLNSRVLLMYTDTVMELQGYPVQNCPSGSFLSWGGPACRGGGDGIWYCANVMRQKETLECCVHLYAFVSYRRPSPQFQFSLSVVTLVYLSQCSGKSEKTYFLAYSLF